MSQQDTVFYSPIRLVVVGERFTVTHTTYLENLEKGKRRVAALSAPSRGRTLF